MNYLVTVSFLGKKASLPEWVFAFVAEVKFYYGEYPTNNRDETLNAIGKILDSQTVVTRKTKTSGKLIRREVENGEMTVFSIPGKTPYVRISFTPTDKPIVNYFNF